MRGLDDGRIYCCGLTLNRWLVNYLNPWCNSLHHFRNKYVLVSLNYCSLFSYLLHSFLAEVLCIICRVCAGTDYILIGSSSNCWLSNGSPYAGRKVSDFHCVLLSKWWSSRKGCLIRHDVLSSSNHGLLGFRKCYSVFSKPRRGLHLLPFASSDDGVTVNGSLQASSGTDLEKMRVKLNRSLEDEEFCDGLVQALYDATRVFELAIKEHKSFSRMSWLSTAWLGVDQNAWVKALSCQVWHLSCQILSWLLLHSIIWVISCVKFNIHLCI